MEVDMLDRRMIIVSHYLFNVIFSKIGLPTDYKFPVCPFAFLMKAVQIKTKGRSLPGTALT